MGRSGLFCWMMLTVRAWLQFYGRRPVYICSFTLFSIWLIPCAFARNIQTMLVARFLDGLAGSAFLSVAGGTVGDMFAKHVSRPATCLHVPYVPGANGCIPMQELSAPMMVYTAGPFIGPEVGPLVGGFIMQNTTWR